VGCQFYIQKWRGKYSLLDLSNPSSDLCKEMEGDISCFQSSPLYDSSDHEDASVFDLEQISNHNCRDLFIDTSIHDFDLSMVDPSKPLVFVDLPSDVLELPQVVEALQLKMMVMLGFCSLEADSNSNKTNDAYFKAPHRSSAQIENQSVSQFSHPPYILHNPIAQSLKESYLASSITKHEFSSFFMFAHFRSSEDCSCISYFHNCFKHHNACAKCFS